MQSNATRARKCVQVDACVLHMHTRVSYRQLYFLPSSVENIGGRSIGQLTSGNCRLVFANSCTIPRERKKRKEKKCCWETHRFFGPLATDGSTTSADPRYVYPETKRTTLSHFEPLIGEIIDNKFLRCSKKKRKIIFSVAKKRKRQTKSTFNLGECNFLTA